MYIWIGLIFNKKDEEYIRSICKDINKNYNLDEVSFSLPQHISLKTSFYIDNYNEVINYIKKSLKENLSNIKVKINGITKINNGVIWLDIEENNKLRRIHNILNDELLNKYNIPLKGFDGDKFKFHSTLFQDKNIDESTNDIIEKLKINLKLPIILDINEVNFGLSNSGNIGTYKVYDTLILKRK